MTARELQSAARRHGTPVVIVDHEIIRRNYAAFRFRGFSKALGGFAACEVTARPLTV